MPSLFQDAPAAPIQAASIIGTISDLLTQHRRELPPWWKDTNPILTKLMELGVRVSAYPSANIVWKKHKNVHDCLLQIDVIQGMNKAQLLRSVRNVSLSRCAAAHLTLFLGVVDAWLRACEEYLLVESARFPADMANFETLHHELESVASLRGTNGLYTFDNLVHLFDLLEEAREPGKEVTFFQTLTPEESDC
ncbi:uncharacterized protein PG998_014790 [Apiospora kogelbergensis]|uniref:uncharacterized protein n=1 Tax=Apiospora kogelbergensis TaxID=1337665 RepID=UPI00312E2992